MLHAVHVIPDFDILLHAQASDPVTFKTAYESEKCVRLQQIRDLEPDLEAVAHRTHIRQDGVSDIISAQNIDLLDAWPQGNRKARDGIGCRTAVPPSALSCVNGRAESLQPSQGRIRCRGDDIRVVDVELKQILLAVDFNPESLRAAPFAISRAEEFQARLGLLYVIEHAPLTTRQVVLERFEELLPAQTSLGLRPEKIVKFGNVPDEILACAAERQADMIVLGVRAAKAHLTRATHFPWSTAQRAIANAACPVLTVRA